VPISKASARFVRNAKGLGTTNASVHGAAANELTISNPRCRRLPCNALFIGFIMAQHLHWLAPATGKVHELHPLTDKRTLCGVRVIRNEDDSEDFELVEDEINCASCDYVMIRVYNNTQERRMRDHSFGANFG